MHYLLFSTTVLANHHFRIVIGKPFAFELPNQDDANDWNTAVSIGNYNQDPARMQTHYQCYEDGCKKGEDSDGEQAIFMTDGNGYALAFPYEPTDSVLAKLYNSNTDIYYYNNFQISWSSTGGNVQFYYLNSSIGTIPISPYCDVPVGTSGSVLLAFGTTTSQANSTFELCTTSFQNTWSIEW